MKKQEFTKFIKDLENEAFELTAKKSADYATDDVLSNFKRMSKIVSTLLRKEITPADMATILLLLKLDRAQNLRGKDPGNESVRDTALDSINYLRLKLALEREEK